jgi:hypothetical protein
MKMDLPAEEEEEMKYLCLSYVSEQGWAAMSESERNAALDEVFGYSDQLRENGNLVSAEGLEPARNATTLRYQNGKTSITDGPFVETKEKLAGIYLLEARDRNHAIQLMSNHPVLRAGGVEIRAVVDLNSMLEASRQRRRAAIGR